jgi:thiaminase
MKHLIKILYNTKTHKAMNESLDLLEYLATTIKSHEYKKIKGAFRIALKKEIERIKKEEK